MNKHPLRPCEMYHRFYSAVGWHENREFFFVEKDPDFDIVSGRWDVSGIVQALTVLHIRNQFCTRIGRTCVESS